MNRTPIGVVRFTLCLLLVRSSPVLAQTELAVLRAAAGQAGTGLAGDPRREPAAADLATIRSGTRSGDPEIARVAVRALGRLERPALIPDITGLLRHANPQVRAEAANAIGQAAQGWKHERSAAKGALDNALAVLIARLRIDDDEEVRATIAETIGRLPYADREEVEKAARALVEFDARADAVRGSADTGITISDRLGIAKGFEALLRINRSLWVSPEAPVPRVTSTSGDSSELREPGEAHERCGACDPGDPLELLRRYVTLGAGSTNGARVRRLALQALLTAGAADETLASKAASDSDAQVRRLALRAAPVSVVVGSVHDASPNVRMEALVQLRAKGAPEACAIALGAVSDPDTQVALVALDQLSVCAGSEDAVAALEHAVKDLGESGASGGRPTWHRAAHALVALAAASPGRASDVLDQFTSSRVWQLRMYAARAARTLGNREALEKLAADDDDNVREAAIDALRELFAHAADQLFVAALARPGHQVLRAAAIALDGTPNLEAAVPALIAALDRLRADGRDNSHDARVAIEKTLANLGAGPKTSTPARNRARTADGSVSDLNGDDLRRLASARARVTIRGVGVFDLLLLTAHAQATVCRFARLAESGYYNGLTFHRVVPNFVVQGGSPGANEYIGDSPFMQDEVARWPHVRGAVGISTRGRDTGDAQFFVNLVDNPRLDHEYTAFAQVLNGLDVIDQILEGDVIERIDIISGP